MLNFSRVAFRALVEVSLWIILIGCAIGGFIVANNMNDTLGWTCLGGLVGLLVGLFIVVNGGGFIATFLEIGNNAVNTKNNTDYIRVDMDAIAKDIAYIKAEYHRHHTGS